VASMDIAPRCAENGHNDRADAVLPVVQATDNCC
jgi:hypothetical protein